MKKYIKQITIAVLFVSMLNCVLAQEHQEKKKGKLDIRIGINAFGPGGQMAKLMEKYGFNDNSDDLSLGGSKKQPYYDKVCFTTKLSYSHYIGSKSQLGIMLDYSLLSFTSGFSYIAGSLDVDLSTISIAPIYIFEMKKYLELEAGPALMFNMGRTSTWLSIYSNTEKYTKLSPGLIAGVNLKIWDRRVTFGKIHTSYLLTRANKMGPFTAQFLGDKLFIPESNINFSYLSMVFVFGFNL